MLPDPIPLELFLQQLQRFGIHAIGSQQIDKGKKLIFLGRPDENIVPFKGKNHPIYEEKDIHPEIVASVLRRFDIPEADFPHKESLN